MEILAGLALLLVIALQVVLWYGLVPFILMNLLQFFGHDISFWLCAGICLLVYLSFNLLKGVVSQ